MESQFITIEIPETMNGKLRKITVKGNKAVSLTVIQIPRPKSTDCYQVLEHAGFDETDSGQSLTSVRGLGKWVEILLVEIERDYSAREAASAKTEKSAK